MKNTPFPSAMRAFRFVTLVVLGIAPVALAAQVTTAQRKPVPPELPTQWVQPPGDPLEHAAAGFAKIL